MAEEAPALATSAPARKKRPSGQRKKDGNTLPKMMLAVFADSKERKGTSVTLMKKRLREMGVDTTKANKRINLTLARMLMKGVIVQLKGIGASGSYKLAKKETGRKPRRSVKKSPVKARKAPSAKRSPAKKTTRAKSPTRKPRKKPAAKKAAAKKSSPKKASTPVKPRRSPKKKKTTKRKASPKKATPKRAAPKRSPKKRGKKTAARRTKK